MRYALFAFALAACATTSPSLHLSPCIVAGAAARCGTFDVAESSRSSRTLALKVIVVPATDHSESAIFPFDGGPGQPVTAGAGIEVQVFAAERRLHDVVLVDERGTGGSAPLQCAEAMKKHQRALLEDELLPPSFVADCRREIETHADLAAYSFPYFTDDVEALRRALGYGPINIVGLSYGTRAALTFLERHPRSVRSMLLLGPLAPENIPPLYFPRDAQAAIDRLIADSAATFPDFSTELRRVFDGLEQKPAEVVDGDHHLRITRGAFGEFFRSMLYSAENQSRLPLVIHLAATGDWTSIAPLFVHYRNAWYDTIGPFMAVTCPTDIRAIDPNEISTATTGTLLGDYRVRRQIAACEQWAPGTVPRVHVRTDVDVPILMITGDIDPVTPARWAKSIETRAKRARTIILANSGHVETNPCAVALEVSFFAAGSFERLDDSCARSITRPPFLTKLP